MKIYTVGDITEVLKVSERLVMEWLRTGQLVGIRLGTDWRVMEEDLYAFLQAQKKQTQEDCQEKSC